MGELNYYTQLKARNPIWDHTPVCKVSVMSLRQNLVNILLRKCDLFDIFTNFAHYLPTWWNPETAHEAGAPSPSSPPTLPNCSSLVSETQKGVNMLQPPVVEILHYLRTLLTHAAAGLKCNPKVTCLRKHLSRRLTELDWWGHLKWWWPRPRPEENICGSEGLWK